MLIAMAVYDTEDNKRTNLTAKTLRSLNQTVDWRKHRLIVSDNGSCEDTQKLYDELIYEFEPYPFKLIRNEKNIGTANAINKAWKHRVGEHCVKMDNDVVIHYPNWVDEIEEVFDRDTSIGICGLKRKDLEESPDNQVAWYKSTLRMLPHKKGERWIVVEEVSHVFGTCQAYSSALLDKIGYLYQPGIYGFDDALASLRARIAGYKRVFLPHIHIDHIDPGGTDFTDWKIKYAGEQMAEFNQVQNEYIAGKRSIFYDGGF